MILATDLLGTVESIHAVTGVMPVEGGRHVGRGTRNYLLGLGPSAYLEIIAVDHEQPAPATERLFGLDRPFGPSRLLTWAVVPQDFDGTLLDASERGIDLGAVVELFRPSPQGDIRVRITERRGLLEDGALPFLVDWGGTRHPGEYLPQVSLVAYRVLHPMPEKLCSELDFLGIDADVTWAATPGLELVVTGRHGPVTIR